MCAVEIRASLLLNGAVNVLKSNLVQVVAFWALLYRNNSIHVWEILVPSIVLFHIKDPRLDCMPIYKRMLTVPI